MLEARPCAKKNSQTCHGLPRSKANRYLQVDGAGTDFVKVFIGLGPLRNSLPEILEEIEGLIRPAQLYVSGSCWFAHIDEDARRLYRSHGQWYGLAGMKCWQKKARLILLSAPFSFRECFLSKANRNIPENASS